MRKTCEGEGSKEVGRTLHKYGWCGRQRKREGWREGGSEVRVKQRQGETALTDSLVVSLYEVVEAGG